MNLSKEKQSGYSIVEMLIVVVLLGFCLLAVVAFALRIQIAQLAYSQKTEALDRNKVITSQINKDFENIGLNLIYNPQTGASGAISSSYIPNSDYYVSGNDLNVTVVRQYANSNAGLQSAWVLKSGSGEFSFTPSYVRDGLIGWQNSASESRAIYLTSGGEFSIVENGAVVLRRIDTTLDANRSTDRLIVGMNVQSNGNCTVSYYRLRSEERQLLLKSNKTCPSYPLQSFITLAGGDYLSQVKITGSWFEPATGATTASSRLPLLPTYNGTRMTAPVWINSNAEFSLLPSDSTTDSVNLANSVSFGAAGATANLLIANPLRGEFLAGDFCLLVDFENNKSVLGKISYVSAGTSQSTLTFLPATASTQADFNGFYSLAEDYVGNTFGSRARLVRLKKPVNYKTTQESSSVGLTLSRREGNDPWENVAYGLTNFTIEKRTSGSENIFFIRFDLAVEDSDSTEPQKGELTVSPKALNLR